MTSVYVVITPSGFILGVTATLEAAQLLVRNNPQHAGARISNEPIVK